MKALLLCPTERPEVSALGQNRALSLWPFFGESLAGHWVEHLAARGFKEIKLITRRAEELRAEVGDGARWGVAAECISEARELSMDEARLRWGPVDEVFVADTLPGVKNQRLFGSYGDFRGSVQEAFFTLAGRGRVGAHEIQPGVWVGLRTHVGANVTFEGPCWLGEDVHVDRDAHLGPWSVLEDRVWIGAGAEVSESIVAPETSLGVATSLRHSIASGNILIDWQSNSVTRVTDSFLLCHLRCTPFRQRMRRVFARLAEAAGTGPDIRLEDAIRLASPFRRI